jgi:hypothetical protein
MRQQSAFRLFPLMVVMLAVPVACVIIPGLDVTRLTEEANLIVVGQVTSVWESDKTMIEVQGNKVPARKMIGEIRSDRILRGPSDLRSIRFHYFLPEKSLGYQSIQPLSYGIFFLKRSRGDYEFVSPYYPSVAAVPGIAVQGENDLDRVVGQLAGILDASESSLDQKLEAVYVLSRTKGSSVTPALKSHLQEKDEKLQLSVVAALLERNDMSGLEIAEKTLLAPADSLPPYLLHNLSYAISEGLNDERAVPSLTRLLGARSTETRRAAASALWHTQSALAITPLIAALDDEDSEVRYSAVVGLAEITGQSDWRPNIFVFQSDQKRYLNYWKEWAKKR